MSDDVDEARPDGMRRFIAHPGTLLLLESAAVVAAVFAGSMILNLVPSVRHTPWTTVVALLTALLVFAAYKGCKRWLERAPDAELALPGAGRELAIGLLLGAALFTAATAIVARLGGISFLGVRGMGDVWSMLAVGIISGAFEETLFRGVLFRHLETMLGSWLALALTAAFFGAAHIFNPDATWFAAFAIMMEAGILLGAAFMLTRRLWLAIGIHAAWNFTQGWVFSIPVSGGDAPLGLLITRRDGPDWLTGGDFGLEASAIALVVATAAGLLMLRAAVKRDRLVAPMWRRA